MSELKYTDIALMDKSRANDLSPFWWLYLPIGTAILLLVLGHWATGFYEEWLDSERSVLELVHVLVPLAALVVAAQTLREPQMRSLPWLKIWLGIAAVGSFYIAGEEMSWGQHLLNWNTPEYWSTLNDQNETNLHNTSSWFDQKPRTLLQIGVVVGGIIVPICALIWPGLRSYRWSIILPPSLCFPTAVISELADSSEDVLTALDIQWYLFYRDSEVQETFFYWFILLYLIVLRRRIRER